MVYDMAQKILVVDDEEGIVLLLKDYFELQGYEVITAGGGTEALARISCDPDMIILDINMPDLDGLSVCRKIREKVSCPILFLTARVEEQDHITGFIMGGDDYIVKPFSIEELGARVMAHLRREERVRHTGAVRRAGDLTIYYQERIYESVRGYDASGDSSIIAEHVRRIRNKNRAFIPLCAGGKDQRRKAALYAEPYV